MAMKETKAPNGSAKTYRIGARGAQHRRKEGRDWRQYGYGDQIVLTDEQVQSGRYSHLGLSLWGDGNVNKDHWGTGGQPGRQSSAEKAGVKPVGEMVGNPPLTAEVTDASRSPDGFQLQGSEGHLQPVAQDELPGARSKSKTGHHAQQADEGDDSGDEATVSKRKLNALIRGVEEAHTAKEVSEARQKVIDADFWEAETVPTQKKELLAALNGLKGE